MRGDGGQATGGLAVDTNLGWKGPAKLFAVVPSVYGLWQDPQERYDIFMNNYTETTWTMPVFGNAIKEIMKSYLKYPPRKLQSENIPYITIPQYQMLRSFKEQLENEGFKFNIPVE
jgi:arylsulfatase